MDATDLTQRLPHPPTGDELDELGRSFNGLLDRLQESFVRQQRFTGDASHQLRTPLTALLGQIEVALRRSRSEEEYRTLLANVKRQADRLQQIVEALLFLTRADSEAHLDGLAPIDFQTWLQEHLETWAGHPRAGDVRVENAAAESTLVVAHESLLGQLVDNLLSNACKYSPPGTPITMHVRCEGDFVVATVADQGDGIAPEDLPHIFQPFYRSPRARRAAVEGVGLGLSVAQRIVFAFQGAIDVESTVGRGTCFAVRLPRLAAGESAPPSIGGQRPQDVLELDGAVS
jgi:signal transduction histidine kinase